MRTNPTPQIRRYQDWLQAQRGLSFDSYDALWRWSTTDLEGFWQSIWDYYDLQSPIPHRSVLAERKMPGAKWFEGAEFNYVNQVFRHVAPAHADGHPALVSRNEAGEHRELSWPELRRQVASMALYLREHGLQPGDRVAAYLPNVNEAIVAFLAVASIGGVWSLCAPDMGTSAVLDRFRQIEPKVLIACDAVRYGGRDFERVEVVAQLRAALPSVELLIVHRQLHGTDAGKDAVEETDFGALAQLEPFVAFDSTTARSTEETASFEPLWLAFDHPLWIVYSSGTTGLPKPIVHGHGGTVLVALAQVNLHHDIGCSYEDNTRGERFHWYSSTGWVMWNAQVVGLMLGTTCCIYDGNPGGTRDRPDWGTLWRFASELGVSFFGAGAAFFASCMKAGLGLSSCGDLSRVRALGTTGSPLSPEVQNWGTEQFRQLRSTANRPERDLAAADGDAIWWCNISGGTDFAGAFIGGNRELPQVPGEMQCRLLGCAVEAWNEQGQPVIGEVGELVCTAPMPSMPLYFWNDNVPGFEPGGPGPRYLSSYFDTYPGVWRHGDWLKITPEGGCIIYGRSDATINRYGLRMGTSELYSAVEALPEVLDSMVVDLEYLGRDSYMPLFVVLRPGVMLDAAMKGRINDAIKTALSPRFIPNEIFLVPEVPRTLSGKKQELPIKKLLLGQPIDRVINREAMANPACLEWYVALALERQTVPAPTLR